MQEAPMPPMYEVVILTALRLEYKAVREHLQDMQEITHQGTVYEYGKFTAQSRTWRVAVAEIGMGGPNAAVETERAINYFRPQITLFVGIGGGIKDVKLGDVVVASKVYNYEAGRAEQQFRPRPEVGQVSHDLVQRARAEARSNQWHTFLGDSCPDPVPEVHIGALAAGEKVVASTQSDVFHDLNTIYSDTLVVEMEGHGFLAAVRANHSVHALVVRGISDLIDDKAVNDSLKAQDIAARHAAAFAFQVLASFTLPVMDSTSPLHIEHPKLLDIPSFIDITHPPLAPSPTRGEQSSIARQSHFLGAFLPVWSHLRALIFGIHLHRKSSIGVVGICILLILFLGYHPPRALLDNLPPKLSRPIQEENTILLKWNINGWYDKYNILIFKESLGKAPEQTQIEVRAGEWIVANVESDVTYYFSVEGCAEERFFTLTLYSSCTSWSPQEMLKAIPSAIERKYKDMQQKHIEWGQPIALETYDGGGWYHQDYDNAGSIYWNERIGTVVIYGFIAQEWKQQGRGAGPLGYPITDEHNWSGHPEGRITCFQQGTITWSLVDKVVVHMYATCV